MIFTKTELYDAWIIEPEPADDIRGFFARTFCEREFTKNGLETQFVQHSVSGNRHAGTLRGMHFQVKQHAEVKVVTCVKGAIFDVIIDLRPQSAQFCKWQAIKLSEKNRRRLYVPKGFAHGFQTLCDECEIHYMISEFYCPGSSSGVRYDDPAFAIGWPLPANIISKKDRSWPNFSQQHQP